MISGMVIVSVLYPRHSESHFDHDYYLETHIPLLKSRWSSLGLANVQMLRADSTLDGTQPAWEVITLLSFASKEALQASLAAHGSEILADIPNFTNVQPVLQINQPLEN
jgi:uncharacterized protein (TIGR02118 family)